MLVEICAWSVVKGCYMKKKEKGYLVLLMPQDDQPILSRIGGGIA